MIKSTKQSQVLIILLLLLSGITSYSQDSESFDFPEFKRIIQSKLDSLYDPISDFGGATIGIVLPGGQKCGFAIGLADVENGVKMKPTDRMLGGSTGKIFVSSSIMKLVETGSINLDDKVSIYFAKEDWYKRVQNSQKITIRNLMQHSTGISRYVFEEAFQNDIKNDPDRIWRPEELLNYVLDNNPLFEPGTDFAYSDTNYILLGIILEKASGTTMYDYIDQHILKPFSLMLISPQTDREISKLADGYSSEKDDFYPGKVAENGIYKYNLQFEWAGGGYVMNTMDLAAAGKLIYEGKIFSKDLFDDYFAGIDAKSLGGQWGLGVHIKESPYGTSYGHSGFFPGYITNMLYFPEYKVSVAFQVNTSDGERIGLYRKLFQIISAVIENLDITTD